MRILKGSVFAAVLGLAMVGSMAQSKITRGWNIGFFSDGSQTAPSVTFGLEPNTGWYRNAANQMAATIAGTARVTITGSGINNIQDTGTYTLGAAADWQLARPAAGILTASGASGTNGIRLQFNGIPVVGTCGTSPSITAGSRDTAGSVNIGTGGTATSCTVNFNATWANAPFCTANGTSATPANVRAVTASASTTVLTLTAATAWVASEVVNWTCIGSK